MYCIKCGVELADSEKVCPLCGTPVFHPDLPCGQGEPPYPADHRPRVDEVSRAGVLFVLTVLFVLPAVISVLCDWRMGNGIVWSGYVVGGLVVLYVAVVLPLWFKRPNPAIFVPIDFIVIGLYLFYINFATHGHWCWSPRWWCCCGMYPAAPCISAAAHCWAAAASPCCWSGC